MQHFSIFSLTLGDKYWYVVGSAITKLNPTKNYSARSFIQKPDQPPPLPCWDSEQELLATIQKLKKANQKLRQKVKLLEPLAIKYKQLKQMQ
jgi:hypothetical protein